MVEKTKLTIYLFDKNRIFKVKAKYDPTTRLAESKRSLRSKFVNRFLVDPNHIYLIKKRGGSFENIAFVDNSSRKTVPIKVPVTVFNPDGSKKVEEKEEEINCATSVQMHSDKPIDQETVTKLDILSEQSFWKSLMERQKLAISTVLILLCAGIGLYHLLLVILRMFGFNV